MFVRQLVVDQAKSWIDFVNLCVHVAANTQKTARNGRLETRMINAILIPAYDTKVDAADDMALGCHPHMQQNLL